MSAPQGVSASVSGDTFTVGWSAVAGTGLYEVQHRIAGSGDEWARAATSTAVSLTYIPEGGPVCETSYEFRVRAYGDGTTYGGGWGEPSGSEPVTTDDCTQDPEFAEPLGYTFTAGNEDGKFAIGGDSGDITVSGALDHETVPSYDLTTTVEVVVTDVPEESPAAPGGLSVSLSGGTFTVEWETVTGAAHYEAQYLVEESGAEWDGVLTTVPRAVLHAVRPTSSVYARTETARPTPTSGASRPAQSR